LGLDGVAGHSDLNVLNTDGDNQRDKGDINERRIRDDKQKDPINRGKERPKKYSIVGDTLVQVSDR